MKVLITGALGGIAQGGVIQVLEKNFELKLTDYKEPEKELKHKFIKTDIRDYLEVRKIVKEADAIVHLGAIANPSEDPFLIYSTNVMGTINLLESARQNNIKRFIYASSIHIYGLPFNPEYLPIDEEHPLNPCNPYALSKFLSEEAGRLYTKRYDFTFISLRIGSVFLRKESYNNLKKENIKDRQEVLWNHIHPRDIGQLIKLSLLKDIKGFEAFNAVADDHTFPEISSLELIRRFFPLVKKINNKDNFLIRKEASLISIEKAKRILGYKPNYNFRDCQKWETLI